MQSLTARKVCQSEGSLLKYVTFKVYLPHMQRGGSHFVRLVSISGDIGQYWATCQI